MSWEGYGRKLTAFVWRNYNKALL